MATQVSGGRLQRPKAAGGEASSPLGATPRQTIHGRLETTGAMGGHGGRMGAVNLEAAPGCLDKAPPQQPMAGSRRRFASGHGSLAL